MQTALQRAQSLVGTSPGRPDDDFYPTPPSATIALLNHESFSQHVWEPACGDGAISKIFENRGHIVRSTDLYDHGYGTPYIDFLKTTDKWDGSIVTNPPFRISTEFIVRALDTGCDKLALLAKLAVLESYERTEILMNSPLKYVYVFRNRLKLTRNGLPYKNGGMIAFAWLVWDRSYIGEPVVRWIMH